MNKPFFEHAWNVTSSEACKIQKTIASLAIKEDQLPHKVNFVAGVDVQYNEKTNKQTAAIVIVETDSLNIIEEVTYTSEISFPYISGLFSFRELPSLLVALKQVKQMPDLIICDGQGLAHPRLCGIATHLGVLINIPTIGCGKTRLVGTFHEPGTTRGSWTPLCLKKQIVGAVLRTQDNKRPLFVSTGHRISLETACQWILKLAPRYRLPEVIRYADAKARASQS